MTDNKLEGYVTVLYDIVSLIEDGFHSVITSGDVEPDDLIDILESIDEAIANLEDAYTRLSTLT